MQSEDEFERAFYMAMSDDNVFRDFAEGRDTSGIIAKMKALSEYDPKTKIGNRAS